MTVLVAYVPTPEGNAAFTAAVEEAGRRQEPLVVLNTPREGAPVSVDVASEATVAALVERATAAGVDVQVRQDAHAGDLADEVVRVADAVDASVIVIGLRRRSPVGKLIMGSAAHPARRRSARPRRQALRLGRRRGQVTRGPLADPSPARGICL